MPTVALPAGTVHYREAGPAEGQVVVFVHGFLVDSSLWSDVPDRLVEQGFRTYAPTWPLGSHPKPMHEDADLSPRGIARTVVAFLDALDLHDVVLVGSDTGGGICQLVLDEDPSRVARLVLTNCDAFDTFPPFPFDLLFRAGRRPGTGKALLGLTKSAVVRNSKLGFGWLVKRRIAPEESAPWVAPYLGSAEIRRDVATFCRAWTGSELSDSERWLSRFERPVLLCWAPGDPFFKVALAHRMQRVFPDVTLVEFPDAATFVSLDEPERLATTIVEWVRERATA